VTTTTARLTRAELRAARLDVVSRLGDDLAHEIKNPLHAMLINLEVLRRRVAAGDEDAALDRAQVIEDEIHRVHRLVDSLLRLIRPQAEEAEDLDVDEVLEEVSALVSIQAKLARVPFRFEPSGGCCVHMTRDSLRYVTLALLEHILETLGPDGGELGMTAVGREGTMSITMTAVTVAGAAGTLAVKPGSGGTDPFAFARALLREAGGSVELDDESTGAIRVRIPCRNDA
jgi:nitrogen-specific signal transduction histidine kinase